jgi:hypothetical protein
MQLLRYIAAIITIIVLTNASAMALEPITATIRVVSESLYDYVVIGEHPQATDGFDNTYDTISPGNLNKTMGQQYISVTIIHPDWKPAMQELRGDIRSLAHKQEWELTIRSSLPEGTPINVALRKNESVLPQGVKLTLRDDNTKKNHDLKNASYMIQAPGPKTTTKLFITVEQP